MDVKIEGDGNTIAGRDINQIVVTPEVAALLISALQQMQGKSPIHISRTREGLRIHQQTDLEELLALRWPVFFDYLNAQARRWLNSVTATMLFVGSLFIFSILAKPLGMNLGFLDSIWSSLIVLSLTSLFLFKRMYRLRALMENAQVAKIRMDDLEMEIARRRINR